MSLNWVDNAKIKEAHEAAAVEPGGWFLLKYVSRDEVELLGRGNGGIVDIRNSIAQHEETSPLFGFLRYRRRNVLIKYLPEGCSRLFQARATVHFNSVCDRFAPYDTTFSIATSKELKDTKLSAACSLHAASGSTSSSTSSLRRRRLMEIAEEEEEEQRASKRQSVVKEEERPDTSEGTAIGSEKTVSAPPVTLNSQLAGSLSESKFANSSEPPSFIGVPRPPSPAKSFDAGGLSSTRPDLHNYSSYPYGKPKVKLAPRPSLDIASRPRTSTSTGSGTFRPVAAMPSGFKMFSKKKGKTSAKSQSEADSQIKEEEVPDIAFLTSSIPIPEDPPANPELRRPHTSGGRPTTSSGVSIRSTMGTTAPSKLNTMTPEKARLMKALRLRERKKKMGAQQAQSVPAADVAEAPSPAADSASVMENVPVEEDEQAATSDLQPLRDNDAITRRAVSNADSGIDVASASAADRTSVHTQTDSHPASPLGMSSEIDDSTKASSLSESTDETVRARLDQKPDSWESEYRPTSPSLDEEKLEVAEETAADDGQAIESTVPETSVEGVERMTPATITQDEIHETSAEAPSAQVEKGPAAHSPVVAIPMSKFSASSAQEEEVPLILEDFSAQPATQIATEETSEADSLAPAIPRSKFSTSPAQEAAKVEESAPILPMSKFALPSPLQSPVHEGEPTKGRPVTPPLRIPKSKFSTQDLKTAAGPTVPTIATPVSPEAARAIETCTDNAADAKPTEEKRSQRKAAIEPIKTDLASSAELDVSRSDAHLSDDEDLLDELQSATVQEAKPMIVSKSPMTANFPSTCPPRPGPDGDNTTPRVVRTVSNPIRGPLLVPGDVMTSSARAVSSGAAYLHKITQQADANLAPKKSTHLGSSISQRIKALEKLSATEGNDAQLGRERPSLSFFSVKKQAIRPPSRSPSVVDRAQSLTRGQSESPPQSRQSSPETGKLLTPRDRSGSMANRLSIFEGGMAPRGRPETIQVTARIIRDPGQPFPKLPDMRVDSGDANHLSLKQSPLLVDLQRITPTPRFLSAAPALQEQQPTPKKETIQERRMSREKRRSESQDRSTIHGDDQHEQRRRRRSSLSIVKDFIKERRSSLLGAKSPSTDNLNALSPGSVAGSVKSSSRPPSAHTTTGFSRRLSIGSRRSMSKDREATTSVPSTPFSPAGTTDGSGSGEDSGLSPRELGHKRTNSGGKSRASRFMRRLSSSLAPARKNGTPTISPTVAEEEEGHDVIPPSRGSTSTYGPTISAFMGDVNVQFPDNLLWKRRTMCLDSHGFLILSAIQGATATTTAAAAAGKDKQAGAIKRYHLSDFRQPYTPEMEVQELPNSVCLDFVDGSGLQIACEDRAGQMNILATLQDAHRSHMSFGQ